MKKPQIARRIARRTGVTPAEAADQLDRVVQEILESLRHGGSAELPGLGRFCPVSGGRIRFEQEEQGNG